jgi:hypothetical protein
MDLRTVLAEAEGSMVANSREEVDDDDLEEEDK